MKESTRIYLQEHIGEDDTEFIEMLPDDVHSELDAIAGAEDGSIGVRWKDWTLPSRNHFEFALGDLRQFGEIARALNSNYGIPFTDALCRLHYYELMFIADIYSQEEFGVYIMENTSADISEELTKKFFRPISDRSAYKALGEYYSTGVLMPVKTDDGLSGSVVGTRNYEFVF